MFNPPPPLSKIGPGPPLLRYARPPVSCRGGSSVWQSKDGAVEALHRNLLKYPLCLIAINPAINPQRSEGWPNGVGLSKFHGTFALRMLDKPHFGQGEGGGGS
mmetsp:Transcript_21009/g.33353  ORF Transcript_21009/g.33353 Transcript_21009/m.33353 type:complete len:103 (+) Transcript_21009:44-352(+)